MAVDNFLHANLKLPLIIGAVLEELEHRVIIQELLLRRIPKRILQQYNSKNAHLVDHKIARIGRIALSSLSFTLPHVQAHGCSDGGLIPYFTCGLIFGAFQEVAGHPLYSMVAHIGANALSTGWLLSPPK